ncbi:hypothetical protein B0H14DRAFT_3685269 [Mycena olivaceomarginata]|nr:hypothetical protein B0H14DRAFT_3685269 [Mycena olivaceomarginata]
MARGGMLSCISNSGKTPNFRPASTTFGVFLNRQTAVAHQNIFSAIEDIVHEDTGKRLRWRHLHGADLEDFEGHILQWGADQHRVKQKDWGYICRR